MKNCEPLVLGPEFAMDSKSEIKINSLMETSHGHKTGTNMWVIPTSNLN